MTPLVRGRVPIRLAFGNQTGGCRESANEMPKARAGMPDAELSACRLNAQKQGHRASSYADQCGSKIAWWVLQYPHYNEFYFVHTWLSHKKAKRAVSLVLVWFHRFAIFLFLVEHDHKSCFIRNILWIETEVQLELSNRSLSQVMRYKVWLWASDLQCEPLIAKLYPTWIASRRICSIFKIAFELRSSEACVKVRSLIR